MANHICSTFTINMFEAGSAQQVAWHKASDEEVKTIMTDPNAVNSIGHQSTADIIRNVYGYDIEVNRINAELHSGDTALIWQYFGPRLGEGVIALPEGATMLPMIVTVA